MPFEDKQCIYTHMHVYIYATGYGLDDRWVGVRVPVRSTIFSSPRHPGWLWGPPIQRVPGAPSSGGKRPRREADHSHPTSAEVKKM
jgi:hypothetical protein